MARILVLHGPNLNLLGQREPEIYGTDTLDDINRRLRQAATDSGHTLDCFHSNAEHELIDHIQSAPREGVEFILFNPGAFTHTSIALRDALLAVDIPFIEVHLSNVFAREDFRQHSFLSDIAVAVVSGLGAYGYELAFMAATRRLEKQ